jgi:hypothetical protein
MQTTTSSPPARRTTSQVGQYLYAVIDGTLDLDAAAGGIDGACIAAISDGGVAVVVSEVPNAKLRPERRRLAAHHDVLKRLRQTHTVLPMSFGLIADSPEAVRKILAKNRDVFVEQIQRLASKVEMGLHVVWDVPNIYEYFVETHPQLTALRDQFFRSGRQPSQDELIELGRTFDRLLNEDRALHTQTVMHVLSSRCSESKENKPRHEREVMNLAFLIDQDAQRAFEDGVIEAARRFDNHYAFDFNGPWLPHNFVVVNLEL